MNVIAISPKYKLYISKYIVRVRQKLRSFVNFIFSYKKGLFVSMSVCMFGIG